MMYYFIALCIVLHQPVSLPHCAPELAAEVPDEADDMSLHTRGLRYRVIQVGNLYMSCE